MAPRQSRDRNPHVRQENGQRETKRRVPARREQGLVLDDFLAATCDMRRDFKLRTPQFGLQQIEQYPTARESLKKLIQAINQIEAEFGTLVATCLYHRAIHPPARAKYDCLGAAYAAAERGGGVC